MVIGAEREPELETGNGHTSCIMWSTCTCASCLDLRDEHRVSLLRENFPWACCPCGWVWVGCGFITIKSLSYICCIFKSHLLSEIKYSYRSHDAGLTDWSENQLCPQTLPVLMEPINMDSLNKATSSEGACAPLSEGSTIWNTTPLQGETFPVADSAVVWRSEHENTVWGRVIQGFASPLSV